MGSKPLGKKIELRSSPYLGRTTALRSKEWRALTEQQARYISSHTASAAALRLECQLLKLPASAAGNLSRMHSC
jgi:hypothetical protein